MIKNDLLKAVAENLKLSKKEASHIVDSFFRVLKTSLAEGNRIELRNFGVFQVKNRAPRVGRNPKTKVEAPIPARKAVTFKAGEELKRLLNQA